MVTASQYDSPAFPHSLRFENRRKALKVSEVATMLAISERHIVDLIDEGKLRAIDLSGQNPGCRRHYRIPVEFYERYVRENIV